MDYSFNKRSKKPSLYSCDSIITEVNKEFIDLTGFRIDELVGKSLTEVGYMLKINSQILLHNIENKYSGFIFTSLLEAREVDISLSQGEETNDKVYTFIEKSNSRLKDKLIFVEQTFIENVCGVAIYSLSDLILLKANQKYLDFFNPHFNKEKSSIGRSITEIIPGFVGGQAEVLWKTVVETQKTGIVKEVRFDDYGKGITYWDYTITPIFENGKMKYIFLTSTDVTDRVLKNQSIEEKNNIIQEQNTQLMSIIENLSEGVILRDNKGKLIMANPEAKRLIYKCEKTIDLSDAFKNNKYFNMEGKEISFDNMPASRALRGESVKNVKMFIRNPDEDYFMDNSSTPIYNTDGELSMVISCFHDITETVGKSKKIEEQKKELEAIIENISDGITILDSKGKCLLSNKSARELFCISYENIDRSDEWYKKCENYSIDGERIDSKNTPPCRVIRGEKFKNMRLKVKYHNKTLQIDVSGTPIYDKEGKLSLGVLCSRDMTDYVKHEKAIRSKYEFLNKMIDTFNLPVIRLSCPGFKIVDINKKAFTFAKLLNPNIKSRVELKHSNIKDLCRTLKTREYYKCIQQVRKEKKTKYLNGKKYFINGKDIYWNLIFEPIFELEGELQEILVLIIDVTAEVKSKITMEKALEAQDEIFANISHELKTPLNVIFTTAQLLKMYCNKGSLDENKDLIIKYIDSIKQNSYRLSKLSNNIVDLSKIKSGFFELNLSNNNIVEVVEEIVMSVTDFTKSKGLNIIFDTDIEEKNIDCDPETIERIILNLISNAIKFSEAGNEIFVDIKDRDEFVEISVKDNGIGIEANNLNMIFDRFKQVDKSLSRNAEGTGIGLSLVKSIVELHGGNVYVESKLGKGSKFTIMLPNRKVVEKNIISSGNMRDKSERVQVELSDIQY